MKLAVRIQHHPSRVRHLALLENLLDETRVEVIEDTTNTLSGCKKALSSIGSDDTHILVLQDDCLPSKDLIATCKKIIKVIPDKPITLFSAYPIVTRALKRKQTFAKANFFYGAVAYILPREIAKGFLEFSPRLIDTVTQDEIGLSVYFYTKGIETYITAPSLVEHLAWRESTLSDTNNRENRIADSYLGLEKSGLDIDWQLDDPPLLFNETVSKYETRIKK